MKIILKKNVKGNEQMVYDELEMLQRMKHPHIVRFVDWFESRVREYQTPWQEHTLTRTRTNIILSLNWLLEGSCSTGFVSVDDSRRRMPHRLSDRSLKPSIISTTTMLSIEVGYLVV